MQDFKVKEIKSMKRMKLKQGVKDVLGIMVFYGVIILGIILLSNNAKKADTEVSANNTNVNYKVNK